MPAVIRKTETTINLAERRRDLIHALSWQVVHSSLWSPPTDLYETQNEYVVRVEVAGMSDADFEVLYENGLLIINGARPDVPQRRAYHQMEISTGKFSTTLGLTGPLDVDSARAEYADGFLTVTLPKAAPDSINQNTKE